MKQDKITILMTGYRPYSDENVTTGCSVKIDKELTKEEFIYKLQDMFVAILEQETAKLNDGDKE